VRFLDVRDKAGHTKTPMLPNTPTHKGDRIRESWRGFDIPGSLSDWKLAVHLRLVSQQCYPREQAHQNGCCPGDGFIRPLTLGFYAQMSSHFLESDLDLPTANEPFQNLDRVSGLIGTQQRFRLEPSFGVTDQDPANGYRGHAAVIPNGSIASDLDLRRTLSVPIVNPDGFPDRLLVCQDLAQCWETLAFLAWTSNGSGLQLRCGLLQGSIQTQLGHHVYWFGQAQ
jgi:hypothetical protein